MVAISHKTYILGIPEPKGFYCTNLIFREQLVSTVWCNLIETVIAEMSSSTALMAYNDADSIFRPKVWKANILNSWSDWIKCIYLINYSTFNIKELLKLGFKAIIVLESIIVKCIMFWNFIFIPKCLGRGEISGNTVPIWLHHNMTFSKISWKSTK